MILRLALAIAAGLVIEAAYGRGVSPYLSLQLSPEIERQVERVLILADEPILKRPIAAATVLDALPAACAVDPALCAEVRRYLSSYTRNAALTHASAAASTASGSRVPLPNRHGMYSDSDYEISAAGFWQPIDRLLFSAGFFAYEDEVQPTGSVLSAGSEYAQLDIGYRDHWLSPFTQSAMLLGTQAQTMPSVTISNYTPLTRWSFRYELFLAEMSYSDRIRYGDGFTAGNPRLVGMHLSIEPLRGWSIAVNRLMQFGGGERGGNSLGDVLDAFFNPSEADNIGPDLSPDEEFGNQAASITSRILIPSGIPFSVYFEYAGEDTSTLSNLRLGNVSLAGGVHFPDLGNGLELTLELSEWQNAWYVHGIYLDGLRHEQNVIGHWGGDWRVVGDGVGAVSFMGRLGWHSASGGWLEAGYRMLENESYSAATYERAHLLDIVYSRGWRDLRIGAELNLGKDVFGDSFSRFSAFIRF